MKVAVVGAGAMGSLFGAMLAEGRALLRHAPWISAAPGLAITFSVLAFNLLGDALHDALDAKTQR